jgi:hypothetical protein
VWVNATYKNFFEVPENGELPNAANDAFTEAHVHVNWPLDSDVGIAVTILSVQRECSASEDGDAFAEKRAASRNLYFNLIFQHCISCNSRSNHAYYLRH